MTFVALTRTLLLLCIFFVSSGSCLKGGRYQMTESFLADKHRAELPLISETARRLQNAFSTAAKKGSISSPGPKEKKESDKPRGGTALGSPTDRNFPDSTGWPSLTPRKSNSNMPSSSPSRLPSYQPTTLIRGSADLFEFSIHILSPSYVDGEAIVESLQMYLKNGMHFENLGSIVLTYITMRRSKAANVSNMTEQLFVLDGTAYFDGYAPAYNAVLVEQDNLLGDFQAVQDSLHSSPNIPETVVLLSIDKKDGDLVYGALQSLGGEARGETAQSREHAPVVVIGIVFLLVCAFGASALLYIFYLQTHQVGDKTMDKKKCEKQSRRNTASSSIFEVLESPECNLFFAVQGEYNSAPFEHYIGRSTVCDAQL